MHCFLLWYELISKWNATKAEIGFSSKTCFTFSVKSWLKSIRCIVLWGCHFKKLLIWLSSVTNSFQILMNVELFLRHVEEIWCVSTRMVAIYVYPEQIQCIDHHIWILIQTCTHDPLHQSQLQTTQLLQDLCVGLVTSWMKATNALVSSTTLYIFTWIKCSRDENRLWLSFWHKVMPDPSKTNILCFN